SDLARSPARPSGVSWPCPIPEEQTPPPLTERSDHSGGGQSRPAAEPVHGSQRRDQARVSRQAVAPLVSCLIDSLPFRISATRWARRATELSCVIRTRVSPRSRQRPSS